MPLAWATRLPVGSGRAILLSGRNDDGLGQWSFVTARPSATLVMHGAAYQIIDVDGGVVAEGTGDVADVVEQFVAASAWPTSDADPLPYVMGYLGYEAGALLEAVPTHAREVPDVVLAAYPALWRWAPGATTPQLLARDSAAAGRLLAMLADTDVAAPPPSLGPLGADDSAEAHCARIAAVQAYIVAGDVYQVNVARRWSASVVVPGDALALLAGLNALAPAPYSGMLEFTGAALVSASPEMFLQQRNRRVETRPIKGTRPRTGDVGQDAVARAELLQSEKDSAEHLMIVDLERNDLGRICEVGSVRVSDIGYVVELPQLYHRVSRVTGTLRAEVGIAALLRATFPGGSITGAPKVRAMQIIAEVEPWSRGPYCGGFGWFGRADGAAALELAIAIRIGVLTETALHVYVGGGIVADSDPLAEVRETDDKLAGWRTALQQLR